MKLTARPHADPQPPEPTVELYLEQRADSVVVCEEGGRRIARVSHDGERFVVQSLNDTRTQHPGPLERTVLEALRPIVEAARRGQMVYVSDPPLQSAIAAFDAADKQQPGPLERTVFEPKRTLIHMTDKLPDRPGLWLLKSEVDYEVHSIRNHNGKLVCEGYRDLSSFLGPWSDQPLEISE